MPNRDRWDNVLPLATAGTTKEHVVQFWTEQNFDLQLANVDGKTPLGNCDLCFLKSAATSTGSAVNVNANLMLTSAPITRVSKNGHKHLVCYRSFETRPAAAPQDEVVRVDLTRKDSRRFPSGLPASLPDGRHRDWRQMPRFV